MSLKNNVKGASIGAALTLTPTLLERIEGIEYEVYYDIAGVPTVCSGITGPDVIPGKKYTPRECAALLTRQIGVAQRYVDKKVNVEIPVTMRASLYSFTYNVGTGAFGSSTMLKLKNQSKHKEACNQPWRWVPYYNPFTFKREVSRGLKNRRAEESAYCDKEL
ncbi:endolysin [Shigella phage vB_SflS-ISF001]|uniref:Lysozyme n=1 Tax=Shigella phage vB_SflS-ISF001 TaxID=2048005 RepID=A0A2D1GPW4_9CAUD|nr:endolysin [Shigella phage vB_SflS-ISF001]ATN94082.1 endolysin [Shigella phage vB_SflS-ISF001]